jgi:biotin carboxylase
MGPDLSQVTHVIVGFTEGLLPAFARRAGPGQLLFIEEPDVIEMRRAVIDRSTRGAVAGVIEAPTQDEEAAERLPGMLTRPPRLRAVLPGVEYGVVAAAVLAQSWGMAGAGPGAARVLRDKAEMRRVADLAYIRQPRWSTVSGPREIEEFRASVGGSCVAKPTDRQGSLGVMLLRPGDDVGSVWQEMLAAEEPGGLRSRERLLASRYLVEQRLSGSEVSVQALVAKGRVVFANITAKDVLPGRYPIELGHTVPAPIPEALAQRLIEDTSRLLLAADFRSGIAHAEWIIQDAEPQLVECAARVPGDGIAALIDFTYGARLIDAFVDIMEGHEVSGLGRPKLAASIRFLTASPGVVTEVRGAERAWELDDVVDVNISVDPGSRVRLLRSSLDRVGSVVAVAATAREARQAAMQAAAQIQITTR